MDSITTLPAEQAPRSTTSLTAAAAGEQEGGEGRMTTTSTPAAAAQADNDAKRHCVCRIVGRVRRMFCRVPGSVAAFRDRPLSAVPGLTPHRRPVRDGRGVGPFVAWMRQRPA